MKKMCVVILLGMMLQMTIFSSTGWSQNTVLHAGIAKIDITPSESLYMGGYSATARQYPSDGHNGRIYIRVLVFDDEVNRIALIVGDLVGYPRGMYDVMRTQISENTGIPFENILLGSTHNHAAPTLGGNNEHSKWSRTFTDKLVLSVQQAIADLEPVRMGGGTGRSRIAMNRRKMMEDTFSYTTFDENYASQSHGLYKTDQPVKIRELEGVIRLGANPDGPIDDEVGILRIDRLTGEPKAVLVNYACHGTSLGARNSKVSPEWNGHMLEYLEKNIPGVTGIFVQGAAGDINPRIVGGLDGYEDSHDETVELGQEIGKEVVRVFNNIETAAPLNSRINLVNKEILLPRRYVDLFEDFKNTTVTVPVTGVRIDDFTWVTYPGELFHEIGKTIKQSTHSRYAYLFGYCNGSLRYFPTQKAFSEGGYEPGNSPFAPVAEKIFIKEVKKMLIELQ